MELNVFHMRVGQIDKSQRVQRLMFAGRQAKQGGKKTIGEGFHLKQSLETKGNLSALKDHGEEIEMK